MVRELVGCCREGITNAVKHGNPGRIDLAVLFGNKQVALLISDNGRGCREVEKGNGLILMKQGIECFQGTVSFRSEPGEGFQLTLRAPYPSSDFKTLLVAGDESRIVSGM